MINRIAQLGPAMDHFRSLTAWPTPKEILRAGDRFLYDVCRLGYRVPSILTLCRDVHTGRFDPDALYEKAANGAVTTEELLDDLRAVRGIGPASAHFLLTLLGRFDRLSIDTSTVAHVARVHTNGKKPTRAQIEDIYAPYGKWKNLVWWFELWLTWETARQIVNECESENGPMIHPGRKRRRAAV